VERPADLLSGHPAEPPDPDDSNTGWLPTVSGNMSVEVSRVGLVADRLFNEQLFDMEMAARE
jgi:hypothetical protein